MWGLIPVLDCSQLLRFCPSQCKPSASVFATHALRVDSPQRTMSGKTQRARPHGGTRTSALPNISGDFRTVSVSTQFFNIIIINIIIKKHNKTAAEVFCVFTAWSRLFHRVWCASFLLQIIVKLQQSKTALPVLIVKKIKVNIDIVNRDLKTALAIFRLIFLWSKFKYGLSPFLF